MRTSIFAAFVALAAVFVVPASAGADQEFDVTSGGGKVTVVVKGNWHINKEYPWKLIVGDTKIDKSKFTLGEKEASVTGAPKGAGKLKGAICSGDTCKPFEKDVTVQ